MQASTATCRAGGSGSGPSKVFAYSAFAAISSSVTVIGLLVAGWNGPIAGGAAGAEVPAPGVALPIGEGLPGELLEQLDVGQQWPEDLAAHVHRQRRARC